MYISGDYFPSTMPIGVVHYGNKAEQLQAYTIIYLKLNIMATKIALALVLLHSQETDSLHVQEKSATVGIVL